MKNPLQRARGIASIEFVIILPVLLMLLFGVMEYGWMLTKAAQLSNAARDGARVGARDGSTGADITNAVNTQLTNADITGATVIVTPGINAGDTVSVDITVPYNGGLELTGFFPPPLIPDHLHSEVIMRKEGP